MNITAESIAVMVGCIAIGNYVYKVIANFVTKESKVTQHDKELAEGEKLMKGFITKDDLDEAIENCSKVKMAGCGKDIQGIKDSVAELKEALKNEVAELKKEYKEGQECIHGLSKKLGELKIAIPKDLEIAMLKVLKKRANGIKGKRG